METCGCSPTCAHIAARDSSTTARASASTLVCPYHRWAYRLDGSLIGAPLADGADLDGACLPEIRHVVWEGFVLVNLSGDAADPFDDLAGLVRARSHRGVERARHGRVTAFESTWNWKVMVENWIECYHHLGTHRDSVELFQPARATRVVPQRRRAVGVR